MLATVTACSESQDYAVPQAVCGTAVKDSLTAPLLPPGESVEEEYRVREARSKTCWITVDRRRAMILRKDRHPDEVDPLKLAHGVVHRLANPEAVDLGARAALGDDGALVTDDCVYEGEKQYFTLEIVLDEKKPENVAERRRQLMGFARAYLPEAAAGMGCEE
ncbi:hypothetical protein IQ279_13835 [Streptomyces verrucosisporus]|uniref:hypothetical protein n=1 Tax=Streptomyces verrucosisporus TaxID=1695161 RepID=UPI0019CFAE62|nr:hypothetical protein [Streptomyces verrucosisporus]MBN3930700.1 hypothetical protein [Streptomyces verrucosisporus]